jgi:DNA primase
VPADVRRVLRDLLFDDVLPMLRDEGDRIWGPCPFHVLSDDSKLAEFRAKGSGPTWFVRPRGQRRGQSHCFSCKQGGGLADLVMGVMGVGYGEAKSWLAEREGEPEPASPLPKHLRFTMAGDSGFRLDDSIEWPAFEEWLTPMRRYVEKRGITSEQVRRWGIGYALEGFYAHRVVIPVHDGFTDEVVNVMGRTISKTETKRYLWAPKEDRPDPDALFGERCWPAYEGRASRTVYVTEGAINALAVERAVAGLPGRSVAALGASNVRPLHVAKLATFGRVVVLTDPDSAGDGAAGELVAALSSATDVVRVRLQEGRDAADYGEEELRACLVASETCGVSTRVGKTGSARSARP